MPVVLVQCFSDMFKMVTDVLFRDARKLREVFCGKRSFFEERCNIFSDCVMP